MLIVGAGLAGLFLALKLAPRRCTVLSQAPLGQASSSAWAQGGLAAALSPEDDPALHAQDTVKAGAGLVDPAIARLSARPPQAAIDETVAALAARFGNNLVTSMAVRQQHGRLALAAPGGMDTATRDLDEARPPLIPAVSEA